MLKNELHGIGRQAWSSNVYDGQFKYGKKSGYGRCIFKEGHYWIGFWDNDKLNGEGKKF